MSELSVIPNKVTRHAYVKVRHSAECPARLKHDAGQEFGKYEHCKCRKWIFKYDSSVSTETERESAKTRDWAEAQAKAQEWLDQFDPVKVENRRLKADLETKNGQSIRVEVAIAKYIQDKAVRLKRELSTVTRAKRVLGVVDPETSEVKCKGLLLKWLDTLSPRPVFISDITADQIIDFITTWADYKHSTIVSNWSTLKNFFKVCRVRKWVSASPCEDIETPGKSEEEDSIAHFTDEEYDRILAKAKAQATATVN